ncbi:MAG: toll/interleukin-1 receptor domain-containing protein [Dehalococcoidia bacterium]
MTSVFISYSRANAARVEVLARDIKSLGHETWLDQDLSGGQRWWDRILQEIRTCDAFVFALSAEAIDSHACLSEFRYAAALGKPVLPVLVEQNVSDSLMPRELSEVQRIDYTNEDKAAFAALNRGLSSLPPAPPLPGVLPPPPQVPASYLFDLKTEIEGPGTMTADRQEQLLAELKNRIVQGHDPADVRALVTRFRARPDLLVRADRELTELDARLSGEPQPVAPRPAVSLGQEPAHTAPPVVTPRPIPPTPQPAATMAAPQAVSGAWWLAPIVFSFLGGLVAYFVIKPANPKTAKNMLIAGIVMTPVWIIVGAAGGA